MRIIFFGSGNVALPILEELIKDHEVAAVITQPDAKAGRKQELQESPVSSLAKDLKMNLIKPEKLKGNAELLAQLKALEPEVSVVVDYGKILPKEYLTLAPKGAINVHPSALPKYRGPSPIRGALMAGEEYTGVTIMLMDEQMDHGPMLAQEIVKIDPDDNNFTLTDKLGKAAALMISGTVIDYAAGKITPLPQDEAAATYTKIITKEDGKIDWIESSNEIYNQFRAYYPWPGIWTRWNGKVVKITDCNATELQNQDTTENYGSGQVLDGGIVACANNSYLQIKSLQLEGKNETDIKSFLNGYPSFTGSRLQ